MIEFESRIEIDSFPISARFHFERISRTSDKAAISEEAGLIIWVFIVFVTQALECKAISLIIEIFGPFLLGHDGFLFVLFFSFRIGVSEW